MWFKNCDLNDMFWSVMIRRIGINFVVTVRTDDSKHLFWLCFWIISDLFRICEILFWITGYKNMCIKNCDLNDMFEDWWCGESELILSWLDDWWFKIFVLTIFWMNLDLWEIRCKWYISLYSYVEKAKWKIHIKFVV